MAVVIASRCWRRGPRPVLKSQGRGAPGRREFDLPAERDFPEDSEGRWLSSSGPSSPAFSSPGKSKEAEIKRINKELANIRSKFKGRWGSGLLGLREEGTGTPGTCRCDSSSSGLPPLSSFLWPQGTKP